MDPKELLQAIQAELAEGRVEAVDWFCYFMHLNLRALSTEVLEAMYEGLDRDYRFTTTTSRLRAELWSRRP